MGHNNAYIVGFAPETHPLRLPTIIVQMQFVSHPCATHLLIRHGRIYSESSGQQKAEIFDQLFFFTLARFLRLFKR